MDIYQHIHLNGIWCTDVSIHTSPSHRTEMHLSICPLQMEHHTGMHLSICPFKWNIAESCAYSSN